MKIEDMDLGTRRQGEHDEAEAHLRLDAEGETLLELLQSASVAVLIEGVEIDGFPLYELPPEKLLATEVRIATRHYAKKWSLP